MPSIHLGHVGVYIMIAVAYTWSWNNVPLRLSKPIIHMKPPATINHSEYRYGKCHDPKKLTYLNASVVLAVDSYRTQLITRYVKVNQIPDCTILMMKGAKEMFGFSTRLPMQLCYSRVTFIDNIRYNRTIMLELAFFMEYSDPLDFHFFFYSYPKTSF